MVDWEGKMWRKGKKMRDEDWKARIERKKEEEIKDRLRKDRGRGKDKTGGTQNKQNTGIWTEKK